MKLFGYELIFRKVQPTVHQPIVFDVGRVTLNPGDRVVLTCPSAISRDTADRLQAYWEGFYPDTKALVLGDGLKLTVYGPETH